MPFLDELGDFTTKLRAQFAEGNKPQIEPQVARGLSSLHMTFGGLLENLPYAVRRMYQESFATDVVRFDELQRTVAHAISGPTGRTVDELMGDRKGLFEAATREGILQESAANKNTLYRFTPTGRKHIAEVIKANTAALQMAGDEADAYMHYVSGLNMNLMPTGEVKVSPASQLTSESFERHRKAYDPANAASGRNVWNRRRRQVLAFDLETAGGPASTANVNEVAARVMNIGGGRPTAVGASTTESFSVGRMTLGTYSDAGVARGLNIKFRQGGETLFSAATGEGDAFIGQVKPILRQMADAESILGQNIMGFDIDQLLGNVMRTSAYLSDDGDAELRGIMNRIQRKMGTDDYVIDTLKMLGEYEGFDDVGGSLTRSPLMPSGSTTTRSIQNVLLHTNLIDYMKSNYDEAGTSLWDLAGSGGHHRGMFDTTVTAALYESMVSRELALNVRPQNVAMSEIKDIVSSGAFTPMSRIKDPADILDETWSTMYSKGLETEGEAFRLLPVDPTSDNRPILPGVGEKGSLDRMRDIAINDENYYLDVDATYLQQTSIASRGLTTGKLVGGRDELYGVVGEAGDAWETMTRMSDPYAGTLNQDGSIFKRGVGFSLEDFGRYQESIEGLPFSGIGLPERNLTMAAVYGSQVGDSARESISRAYGGALDAMKLAPDMGISFFSADNRLFGPDGQSIIRTASKRGEGTTLGMTVDTARKLNEAANASLFDVDINKGAMSMFEINAGRYDQGSFVNLQMNMLDDVDIADEGRAALTRQLKEMEMDSGIRDTLLRRLSGDIDGPLKVTVGSLADESAETMIEAIEMGAFNLYDGTTLRMPMMDYVEDSLGGGDTRGVMQMGPVMVGDTYTKNEMSALRTQMDRAKRVFREVADDSGSTAFRTAMRSKRRTNTQARGVQSVFDIIPEDYGALEYDKAKEWIGRKTNEGYSTAARMIEESGMVGGKTISPSMLKKATLPSLALGALAAFASHQSEEEELYDQTFEQGSTVPNGYYSQGMSSADPIHKRVRPRINPLSTANLVFDNYDNRIGHTRVPGRS